MSDLLKNFSSVRRKSKNSSNIGIKNVERERLEPTITGNKKQSGYVKRASGRADMGGVLKKRKYLVKTNQNPTGSNLEISPRSS